MSLPLAAVIPALLLFLSTPVDAQLPVHTIERVGGGAITPIALMVNTGRAPVDAIFHVAKRFTVTGAWWAWGRPFG